MDHERPGPLVGGPGEGDPGPPLELDPHLITPGAAIPVVAAQPTGYGRRLGLGPTLSDGSVLLTYGDYDANTGPMDVLTVSPTGDVTTLLDDLPTERIDRYRVLGDAVWSVSIDPTDDAVGFAVTNLGGTWHTIPVGVAGLPVAVHLYDIAQDSGGDLLVCGARDLSDAEGGADYNGGNSGTAFVWRSTDDGATWAEDLANVSLTDGFNRFYDFDRTSGALAVRKSDSSGWFVLGGEGWTAIGSVTVDQPSGVRVSAGRLIRADDTTATLPAPAYAWTTSLAPDGAIWLCDGDAIYRLPPPT